MLQMGGESRFAYRKRFLSLMANDHLLGAFTRIVVTRWVLAIRSVHAAKQSKTCS